MIHLVTWVALPYQLTLCRSLHRAYGDDFMVWFAERNHKDFPYGPASTEEFQNHYLSEEGYRSLWNSLRADREAVIILSGWRSPMTTRTLLMTWLLRIPVFIWADHPHPRARTWLADASRKAYLRFLSRQAEGFLTCGNPTLEYLASLGIDRTKLTVFPYWVEVPEEWSLPARCLGADLDATGSLQLVAVGRLAEVKRFEVAIEAVALANKRAGRISATLEIIGDGPERTNLETLVHSLGCDGTIKFQGWLESQDVNAQISKADALVLTSRFEGYGVAVLEAMAAGRMVLASEGVIAARDRDDGSGAVLLHPVGDVECLADQIALLASDSERLRKSSYAARSVAEKWRPERAITIIDEVLNKTKRGGVLLSHKEHTSNGKPSETGNMGLVSDQIERSTVA